MPADKFDKDAAEVAAIPASVMSNENHVLLVRLDDSVSQLTTALSTFIKSQDEENSKLHARIDTTNLTIAKAVGAIKDSISERGRITPALIAMVLSSLAILGGAGSAYISLVNGGTHADMAHLQREVMMAEQQRLIIKDKLDTVAIEYAKDIATTNEARRWAEKLQDEIRLGKITPPNTK